jgi:PhnB protein
MSTHTQATEFQKPSIAPLLSVRRGASAIDFYQRAFGAREVFRIEDKKGEVVARLSVDGSEFWLADESPKHARAFSI